MFHPVSILFRRIGLGRCLVAAVAVVCLGVVGCANVDLRGDRFQENDLSNYCGRYRESDPSTDPYTVTNKGMQIERNLGVR
jgi:hypothetical protein